jgi:NAD(P)-dependent dehydrogenase (short-subunit alcohol dehydrogenase family)
MTFMVGSNGMKLKEKVAIVTGAGTGIGRAIAVAFAREGALVAVCNRSPETGEETVGLASEAGAESGGRATYVRADVSDSASVQNLIDVAVDTFGGLDILVNNAGLSSNKPIEDLEEETWDHVIAVNLKGHFLCSKYAIPHLKARGGGAIINMSSVLGYVGLANKGPYCSSKAAILGLTRVMALELGRHNIRVNVLSPGSTDTPLMWQGVPPEELEQSWRDQAEAHPVGYVSEPEQMARAAVWLAIREVDFMHGASLLIDGGSLCKPPGPR